MRHNKIAILGIALAFSLGACGQSGSETPVAAVPDKTAVPATSAQMDLAAALASDARSEEDKVRDAGRKPVEVLGYVGVEPGMNVIDLMAAGGWYSEVLSLAVGTDGTVTAQNPPWLLAFRDGYYGDTLAKRIGDRLTNVSKVDSTWAELAASGGQYDAAMSALNFHDAYYLESPEAAAEMMSAVFTVLKPGGVFGIIDHVGSPDGDNGAMHRVDMAIVVDLATAAGFNIDGDSHLLANREDDHTLGVFSDEIRGKTDRFLLRMSKPAE
jgi:predicted methyltransferase